MVMLYFPGGTFGKSYRPASFVVAVRTAFVATSLRVTFAPDIEAPVGSVTVPTMTPVPAVWAHNLGAFKTAMATNEARTTRITRLLVISHLPYVSGKKIVMQVHQLFPRACTSTCQRIMRTAC